MKLFYLLLRYGVLPRSAVKNSLPELRPLLRAGLVRKVCKGKNVFYELTESALPILEAVRQAYLARARVEALLHPRSRDLQALLHDLRFLDSRKEVAKRYLFLSDWQLQTPATLNHLKLAQLRFYDKTHGNI